MFTTLPQELRDLIFTFWSPTKNIRQRYKQAFKVFESVYLLQVEVELDETIKKYFRNIWRSMNLDVKKCELHQCIQFRMYREGRAHSSLI